MKNFRFEMTDFCPPPVVKKYSFEMITGFPLIRENFEDFFQSGKSGKILKTFSSQGNQGKTGGVSAQNQGKNFQIRELFFKPFSNLLV